MKPTSSFSQTATFDSCAAWIGLDWGNSKHAYCLSTPGGTKECGEVPNSPEQLHLWLQKLEKRFGGRSVALAFESNRGPLLNLLAQYPWLHVFLINPATSARYRKAFTLSGAKDDLPDAILLEEILRLHHDKLSEWREQDEPTRKLDALTRLRRELVDQRTALSNQLTAVLKNYFPQALELVGERLTAPVAVEFLKRWPDLISLKAVRHSTIRSFFYKHNVRREEIVQKRLEIIKGAMLLTRDQVVLNVGVTHLKILLEHIALFNKQIVVLEEQIAAVVKEHPEAYLFRELPGAGAALVPRLIACLGTDRGRFTDAASLSKYFGLAPVREKSGNQLWTHWRWHAPTFLRQTLIEWAGQTVAYCPWAGKYYKEMKARGKSHHVILRALAFKWTRILWKCWQTRKAYDEASYLKALKNRKSPYIPDAQAA